MVKSLKWIGLVLAVLLLLVVLAATMGGSAIRSGVERYGPEYTGGSVALEDVDFSVLSGEATISGLVIGNPEGFGSDHAFSLGRFAIKLDPWSVFSDHIQIDEITIDQPDLIVEIRTGGTNLNAIRRNAMQSVATDEGAAEEGPRITVQDLYMLNGTVAIVGPIEATQTPTVPLPDLHIEGIGAEEDGGATIGVAVSEVLAVVVPAAMEAAAKADLSSVAKGILEKGQNLSEGVSEDVGGVIKRGLGGLLKKKDEDEDGDQNGGEQNN